MPYIRKDGLALQFNNTHRWPGQKELIQFGVNLCRLTPAQAKEAIDQVRTAVAKTREEVPPLRDATPDRPSFMALTNMLAAWEDGLSQTSAHQHSP